VCGVLSVIVQIPLDLSCQRTCLRHSLGQVVSMQKKLETCLSLVADQNVVLSSVPQTAVLNAVRNFYSLRCERRFSHDAPAMNIEYIDFHFVRNYDR